MSAVYEHKVGVLGPTMTTTKFLVVGKVISDLPCKFRANRLINLRILFQNF